MTAYKISNTVYEELDKDSTYKKLNEVEQTEYENTAHEIISVCKMFNLDY